MLRLLVPAAALAATAWALLAIAQFALTAYLRDEAAHALALQARGDTPFRWEFRDAQDIVAGRVFRAADFRFDADELVVRSAGAPFEIGLPLAPAADLLHFPLLVIVAVTDAPASLQVVVRQTLASAPAVSTPVLLGVGGVQLDLSAQRLPGTVAMLRLRFELAAGKTLRLHRALLARVSGARLPVLQLAEDSVERQLLALRRIRADQPAAIVLPPGLDVAQAVTASNDAVAHATRPGWLGAVLFAAFAFGAHLRPPRSPRLRALVEIALALAMPLWFVLGGNTSGNLGMQEKARIAIAVVYAASLGRRQDWHLNGNARAWTLACVVVVLAAVAGMVLHAPGAPPRAIDAAHLSRYLGWALIQQFLICAVCLPRWRIATGSATAAIYLSALCFALLHWPNANLMLATFTGGLIWCALYLREHALLPLAFSHAASALLLIALLPPELLLSAEVGMRFFQ